MLFGKFWRIVGNMISLNCYSSILKRKHISKKPDNNNFPYIDKFFYVMIEAMVMILYKHKAGCFRIDKLQTWICRFDWLILISKVEHDYLKIFTFECIWDEASIKTNTTVASILETKKREWLKLGSHWQTELNWIIGRKGVFKEIDIKTHNIIWENALSLLNYGLLYLDFDDACQKKLFCLYKKAHFVFCVTLPEFEQYKICHKNDVYSSMF